ncbi:ABC transporter permease [Actinomyces ruminicola]|uniref:ABC transporter permease n=1 Tax=Actinomyces ruminicola TaxID=332524 RepID=UPI0011CB84EF|nr:ABC transporter permease [Actinomyces ruminicola]
MTALTPTATSASTTASDPRRSTRGLLLATLGIPVVIILMLLAFLAPSINSGAQDLPLALSAPQAVQDQLLTQLDTAAPGVFDVTVVADGEAVTGAVENREAIGGITITADESGQQIEVVTASGAGSPYAALLTNLATTLEAQADAQAVAAAQAQGADAATLLQVQQEASASQTVTVTDVAPLTESDPAGVGLSAIALPLVFGGMASGVILSLALHISPWRRALGAVAIAALGGLCVAAVLQTWFGAVDGSFLLLWAGLSLGIAAISLTLIGLQETLGYAGFGLGAVLMLFVANPLSGIATGWQWLPSGWGTFGQLLPVGAAGTWLRSAAYFDGAGMGAGPWVLTAWIACGLALLAVGAYLNARRSRGDRVS